MKKLFSLLLALMMALSLTTVAFGAPEEVTVKNDTELKTALQKNVAELVINLDPEPGVDNFIIYLNSSGTGLGKVNSTIKSLTINGTGNSTNKTKVSFNQNVTASLFDELTINNCEILRTTNKSWGHLIFSSGVADGVYTISNCLFNGAATQGIYINPNVNEKYVIENCTFNGDFGTEGAIVFQNNSKPTDLTVSGNNFSVSNGENLAIMYHKEDLSLTSDVDEVVLIKSVENFNTAITNADAGDTLKLMVNVDITSSVAINNPVTIDTNGYTMTGMTVDPTSDFKLVDNGDGTFSVAEKTYVAEVAGVQYETLTEAIAAVADGGTVKLLADSAENITVGKALTINVNGKSYTGTMTATNGFTVLMDASGNYFTTTMHLTKYTLWESTVAATKDGVNYIATDMQLPAVNKAVAPVAPALNGSVAYYEVLGAKCVVGSADDCDAYFTVKGKTSPVMYLKVIGSEDYEAVATQFTNFGKKCGQSDTVVAADTKYYTYTTAAGAVVVYAEDTSAYAMANATDFLLVGGKMIPVVATNVYNEVEHVWTFASDASGNVVSAKCEECRVTAKVYNKFTAVPSGADYIREGAYFLVIGAPSAGTTTDKTVQSAQTFDAGIAMYVGMSVMAAAGSAVVISKKKD